MSNEYTTVRLKAALVDRYRALSNRTMIPAAKLIELAMRECEPAFQKLATARLNPLAVNEKGKILRSEGLG